MAKKVDVDRDMRFILEMCKELKEQVKLIELCVKDTMKKITKGESE